MNEQLQAAFDKKFKDTWFFEDVPLNHKTPATTGRTITEADILNFAGISGESGPPSTWTWSTARPTVTRPRPGAAYAGCTRSTPSITVDP